ncbi:hypothetical protein LEMLEM_LOCUS7135 [Lemmus lemmus]
MHYSFQGLRALLPAGPPFPSAFQCLTSAAQYLTYAALCLTGLGSFCPRGQPGLHETFSKKENCHPFTRTPERFLVLCCKALCSVTPM